MITAAVDLDGFHGDISGYDAPPLPLLGPYDVLTHDSSMVPQDFDRVCHAGRRRHPILSAYHEWLTDQSGTGEESSGTFGEKIGPRGRLPSRI